MRAAPWSITIGVVDDALARTVVDFWSGGAGVVARGPKMLMSVVPATPGDVERHTGRRPFDGEDLWRLEIGGRFVASRGTVYPSGVPFPEDLHSQTAVIANEVWLYADGDGDVLGAYWWPDALRRPIASVPRADYDEEHTMHPADFGRDVGVPVVAPSVEGWEPVVAARLSRREVILFCFPSSDASPDPLNEMLVYEMGGVSVRTRAEAERPDLTGFLRRNQPPYRRLTVSGCVAVGRDPGRVLGPQTWPWPAELRWWSHGVDLEMKGFVPLATLVELAQSLAPVTAP